MEIKLLVEGGAMQPGPALSQKIGPLGMNVGEIIQKINDATKNFKGLKVPVELNIEPSTKQIEIQVFSPPVSELLKKELKVEKGSALQKKQFIGNLSIEQIISVAKTKQNDLLCKDLKAAVKTIIGTCTSLGVLVESQIPSELGPHIAGGKFSKEIEEGATETSPEKRKKLDEEFNEIQEEQEQAIKREEEEAKAAEEAKVAEAEAAEKEEGVEGEAKPEGEEEAKEGEEKEGEAKSEEKAEEEKK